MTYPLHFSGFCLFWLLHRLKVVVVIAGNVKCLCGILTIKLTNFLLDCSLFVALSIEYFTCLPSIDYFILA